MRGHEIDAAEMVHQKVRKRRHQRIMEHHEPGGVRRMDSETLRTTCVGSAELCERARGSILLKRPEAAWAENGRENAPSGH